MIHLKFLIDTDLANYKKPCMFLGIGITCTWKCGQMNCQNTQLAKDKIVEIKEEDIVDRYLDNPLSHAFVFGGLEPMDNQGELLLLINTIRQRTEDDIVIYTGYNEGETLQIKALEAILRKYPNIIIKYGRYIPDQPKHFDKILGIDLASPNQYAKRIGEHYEN